MRYNIKATPEAVRGQLNNNNMNKLNVPLNRVLAYGIMYQLRYEFAANEGSMLNGLELDHPEMTIFDLCENFKKLMEVSHEAIDYLMEHEITTYEGVKEFAACFNGDDTGCRAINNALDYSFTPGWRDMTGEIIGNDRSHVN